jgi:RHS repeat-associated protein
VIDRGECPGSTNDDCSLLYVSFPGATGSAYGEAIPYGDGPPSWFGSMLTGMQDASGYLYRRNRYYDPKTGRFTQEDPIGLAGGMNAYGYAEGDPVSYSDPFGLCPPEDNNPYSCPGLVGAFVMLGQAAPAIKHDILSFLPRNLAWAAGGLAFEAGLGKLASALFARASTAAAADHIVLGLAANGLEETAGRVGGRTLLNDVNWKSTLQAAIADPGTKITVSLDGLSGTSTWSKVMSAAQKGLASGASPTNWELGQLYQAGRLSSVEFVEGGRAVANPFR